MNDVKVSVIIPIYNVEEYLEECLMSVVHQTLDGIQVIMIDDGSLDRSSDIAKDFADRYDNFEYIRQVNGGLGNARNTGIQYAKGKYIIFLDSDDIVPDDAYERMYLAAERNHSDMVVGHVSRFNSKKERVSNLHELAFQKYLDKTHITENTDLIYDTTSWNKLIRKEFWDKYNFKFPERILYEDIPVTIPMHYLADNVTMLQDVCYRWRIRDGANKSITQRADDFTNLRDRITVLRMVDKFFKENVTEEKLWEEKHYKWLYIDLMVFVNTCIYLPSDKTEEMIQILRDYINEAIPLETIDKLPVVYREKYRCIMNDDAKRLVQLRQYEVDNYKNIKITEKKGKYIGHFPKDLIPKEDADMESAIKKWRLTHLIEDITWKDDKCIIEGYIFIMGLSVPRPNVRKLNAYLFRTDTGEKIPLQTESIESAYANKKFGFRIDNETKQFYLKNYKGAGYRITIDVKKDILEKNIEGEYFILMTYERDQWKKELILRGIMKSLRKKLDHKSYLKEHLHIELSTTYRFALKLKISKCEEQIEHREIVNRHLQFNLTKPLEKIYLSRDPYDAIKLPANIDKNIVKIALEDIPRGKGYLTFKEGHQYKPILKEKRGRQFTTYGTDHILEEITADNRYFISRDVIAPVISKVKHDQNLFEFVIEKELLDSDYIPIAAKLYVEDQKVEEQILLGEGKVIKEGNKIFVTIVVDLSKEVITKNLYSKKRQVFISYRYEDQTLTFPVKKKTIVLDEKYYTKTRRYRFVLDSEDDCLYFNTLRLEGFFTRSKKKRDFTNRFIYPLLRRLPIKRKWIVFESMWGSKFSCNPRYLYEYIDKYHPDYKCIWVLKDECTPITGNGIRVRRLSFKYLYYMARAKYFVNNVNFHDAFIKRKNQVEVQTMHGTPLKTIGLDVPGDFPTKKSEQKYIKKCKRWDYLIVQSKFVADLAPSAFHFDKTIMETGYPRTDILYQSNNEPEMNRIKKQLGLPTDKKVIMYAPTWRVKNRFELMLDLEKMKERFSDDYILLLRLHHFSAKGWSGAAQDGFVYDLTNYQSIEDLYIITDILITDYSSVMFDYAVLNRPMIFFTYDLDEYRDKLRGFNIDIEKEAPGPLLFTSDEVLNAIEHLDEAMDEARDRIDAFHKHYIEYECGNSSEKVFKMMLGN